MSARSELLDDLTSHIRSGQPISFCKDGDGEQAAMANVVGGNCDGSIYSAALGRKLRATFSGTECTVIERHVCDRLKWIAK